METQTESDPVTFGVSTKGRRTVIYRNFEYVKHRNNKNGEIYWRCKLYQSYKCKGHLKTLDDRIVSNKDQEHTHQGNIATSLARLAVGQMKERMGETSATPAAVVGTFKVVPSIFFQLYTIHFQLVPGNNPVAVYCLLQNKGRATYDIIMEQLKILIPAANPDRILVDFETAAMSAFQAAYPNAAISGCYFHLCQSVLRKVNEVGMKQAYETDNVVRGGVRCLAALALVPENDVTEAFELLTDDIGEVHDRMPELLSYFEHTYIRGRRRAGRNANYGPSLFPIQRWNQYQAAVDGIARTTNAVEGWHYGLQSLFQCHHPTLWTFLNGISKDRPIQKQKSSFLQGISGVDQPPRKKYRDLKDRVGRAVSLYLAADVLQY